jgi:hypothetical protein
VICGAGRRRAYEDGVNSTAAAVSASRAIVLPYVVVTMKTS